MSEITNQPGGKLLLSTPNAELSGAPGAPANPWHVRGHTWESLTALLRLGSVSVIAPMWACDHLLARAWIRAFLAAWNQRGMPKAMAAREAFLALGDGTDVAELGPIHLRGDWL